MPVLLPVPDQRGRGRGRPALALALALALPACDACNQSTKPAEPPEQSSPLTPAPKAILEGVVRLAPDQELPEYALEQMEAKVLDHTTRGEWPEACTPPKNTDRQPVRLSPEGGLTGVAVAASQFKTARSRAPVTHTVVIDDCRLTPRLLIAVKGDTLRVENKVDYPFMPSFGNEGVARSLTTGQKQEYALDKPGVFPVRCGFTAPCGRSDVMVMLHPVHTLTDEHGKFRLEDVPPDQPFVISAWHPLFQEAKADVRVAAGETKQIELVLSPLPKSPAARATGAPEEPTE